MRAPPPRRCGWTAALLACAACGGIDLEPVDSRLEVLPSSAEFGDVPANLRVEVSLTLRNRGDRALEWTVDTLGGGTWLSTSHDAGRLDPGRSEQLVVALLAERPGAFVAALRFETNSRAQPELLIPVRAAVTDRVLDVRPAAVDFGPVRTGAVSSRTLEIRNLGPTEITLDATFERAIDGLGIVGASRTTVAPRGSTTLELAFAPRVRGDVVTNLRLRGDCMPGCEALVPIAGSGVPSSLYCEPEVVDFGLTNPDTCGLRQLSCINLGEDPIRLDAATLDPQTAPFTADPPPLPLNLAPTERLELEIAFCPRRAATAEGLLTLDVFELDVGPRRTTVPVLGQGGGPDLRLSPSRLTFGGAQVGDTRVRTVRLDNVGDRPLGLARVEILPADASFIWQEDLPSSLAPGATLELPITYAPGPLGREVAELVVTTDDPDQPRSAVTLEAEGVPPGQCSARLLPEAVSFGLVSVGASNEVEIELSAGEDAPCLWFDPRVEGDSAFSLVTPPSRRGELPPGRTLRFAVRYEASDASPPEGNLGAFRIDVPHAAPAEMQVPLTAVAADNDLVVFPDVVDFGVRPIGESPRRSIYVYNVGTRTHRLEEIELQAGDGALTLTGPPPRLTLRPDEATRLDLDWAPTRGVSMRATVQVRSNQLPAPLRVPVRGETTEDECGHVTGVICAPHGAWNLIGAEVELTARGQTFRSETDENGRFFAACLPAGPAQVSIRQGHYRAQRNLSVTAGAITSLPSDVCLSPPPAAQIAVVTGRFDEVQKILDGAGVAHSVVSGVSSPPSLLSDLDLLLSYDIVLLNCGFMDTTVRGPEVAANLRAFVAQGGSLYASDLAYDAIEAAWPEALELVGDDTLHNAAETGNVFRLDALASSPAALGVLGHARIPMTLDGGYTVVEQAHPSATVHLAGPTLGPNDGLRPISVTYHPPNALGTVVYTTVHESAQVLDADIRRLLEHLVFEL